MQLNVKSKSNLIFLFIYIECAEIIATHHRFGMEFVCCCVVKLKWFIKAEYNLYLGVRNIFMAFCWPFMTHRQIDYFIFIEITQLNEYASKHTEQYKNQIRCVWIEFETSKFLIVLMEKFVKCQSQRAMRASERLKIYIAASFFQFDGCKMSFSMKLVWKLSTEITLYMFEFQTAANCTFYNPHIGLHGRANRVEMEIFSSMSCALSINGYA